MRLSVIAISLVIIVALLGGGVYMLARPGGAGELGASLSVADALSVEGDGFRQVTAPRPFDFPRDHGPHPDYAIEWWYYTGNLDTPTGRHFGYELTFFRIGVTPDEVERSSEWATRQIYSAHFALTDVENDEFYAFERYSRDALGLAGAVGAPFRVWLEDWSAVGEGEDTLPMRLHAAQDGVEIDLVLGSEKDIVLNGDAGFSRKSGTSGAASYYYSMTRMPTSGAVLLNGRSHSVSGMSWLDREWSSTRLSDEHIGWDWFALQLSDGRDIMYGKLRPKGSDGDAFELGTIVAANGAYTPIRAGDVRMDVLERWQSGRGGTYPSRWRLRIPTEGLDIEVTPYISDQELDTLVRYWEGAVRIQGTSRGQPIGGSGYVELTGYADQPSFRN